MVELLLQESDLVDIEVHFHFVGVLATEAAADTCIYQSGLDGFVEDLYRLLLAPQPVNRLV